MSYPYCFLISLARAFKILSISSFRSVRFCCVGIQSLSSVSPRLILVSLSCPAKGSNCLRYVSSSGRSLNLLAMVAPRMERNSSGLRSSCSLPKSGQRWNTLFSNCSCSRRIFMDDSNSRHSSSRDSVYLCSKTFHCPGGRCKK